MNQNFAIAIHGGAEDKSRADIGPEKEAGFRAGLEDALQAGWQVLNNGGSAVAAVEAAVKSMEDNPLFNAGKGGALASNLSSQFDAAIMDGKTLQAGAVAGIQNAKNPISVARAILEKSEHVLLSGTGAKELAQEQNLELESGIYFKTFDKVKELGQEKLGALKEPTKDTVGAVALDKNGNLAAATSTGGLTNQHNGRIGDSPIIGSGTYANNEVVAISCTGDGESIMRGVVAHEVYALMKYKGLPLAEACKQAREMYKDKIEKDRNLIAINPAGEIAFEYETQLMFRACRKGHGTPFIAIWKD